MCVRLYVCMLRFIQFCRLGFSDAWEFPLVLYNISALETEPTNSCLKCVNSRIGSKGNSNFLSIIYMETRKSGFKISVKSWIRLKGIFNELLAMFS